METVNGNSQWKQSMETVNGTVVSTLPNLRGTLLVQELSSSRNSPSPGTLLVQELS
jgi:hypothetical protein